MAKIYLSSTYSDLKEHREEVYRALRQMRHDVVAMEDYGATDRRPLKKCLEDVAGCDLYIGIFARRYGYVPQEENPGGKSITELEFRQAVKNGKSCLLFLLAKDHPWQDSEEGKGAEKLRAFYEEISREYMVDFFRPPEDLARRVSTAVHVWEKERTPEAAPASQPKKLSHLPAPPTPLVGREQELRTAMDLLQDGTRLLTLTGPGGTGKTRLALKVAWKLEDQFREGAHFVDLAALQNSRLVPSAIAETPGPGEEPTWPLPETLKDALRVQQLLLLLDNFEQIVEGARGTL